LKLVTIKSIYRALNARNFGDVLTMPTILNRRWRDAFGQYETNRNGPNLMTFCIAELEGFPHARAVVYHEMVHQYIEEFLGLDEDDHHGPIFWRNYKLFAPPITELGVEL